MTIKNIALGTVGTLAVAIAGTFALPRHVTIERAATMEAVSKKMIAPANC